ncbi:MAG: hypothetical protein FH749_01170 [Firmicutes bacterium]|nr:hypothetical protein [Bacillota bacterium]
MSKLFALLPILLLMVPGFLSATELSARNFRVYLPIIGFLMLASIVNLGMIVYHRKKQAQS